MDKKWWKEGVAYQAYVRSFKDTNGDGIGDLKGIIEKLDYLKELGVNMLYLNPINKSPNDDNGYDIDDFRDIMFEFGTLTDFDELIKGMHERGMKLILDLVVNHSSDEHPWFKESRKSKDNPYRDYYIWHPGKDGNPPNNWGSFFGGSAWQYDDLTGEYYLHLFSKKMPDFNWRNEKLREEMKDVLRFWKDKGVDGFRMDAINHLEKDHSFPNGIVRDGEVFGDFIKYVQNLPEVHDYLKELHKDVFNSGYHVVIGETGGINAETAFIYTGDDREELDMTFHFDMNGIGRGGKIWERKPINLVSDIKNSMSAWASRQAEEGWNPVFYSNHDSTRTVSRLGDDENFWSESAKMLVTLQMTHKGTPFIYYGDEIGMTNPKGFELNDYRDVWVFNRHNDVVKTGLVSEEDYLLGQYYTSRDNSRTPMQWNSTESSGFTTGTPWINVNRNFTTVNVEAQEKDENSILSYYKNIIKLRKENETLVYGKFEDVQKENPNFYAFTRELNGDLILVIANFFGKETNFTMPDKFILCSRELIISNYEVKEEKLAGETFNLRPYEAMVIRLK